MTYSLNGKNPILPIPAMIANILAIYSLATDAEILSGRDWYNAARDFATGRAEAFGIPLQTVADVISATSPGTRWDRNLLAAHGILAAFAAGSDDDAIVADGIVPGRCPGVNARRAVAILRGETVLTGPKTSAFARNIAGDDTAVTVDVHAARVAMGDIYGPGIGVGTAAYDAIADAYRIAADRVGETPTALQAITWTVCVNRRNGREG